MSTWLPIERALLVDGKLCEGKHRLLFVVLHTESLPVIAESKVTKWMVTLSQAQGIKCSSARFDITTLNLALKLLLRVTRHVRRSTLTVFSHRRKYSFTFDLSA